MRQALISFTLLFTLFGDAQAQQSCLVVGVIDGDTIDARCGQTNAHEQIRIRLTEIDAPEKNQPFGARAKQSLSDLCYQVQATITSTSKDRYGRTLGRVECGGKDAALHQTQTGMAWWYAQYGKDRAVQAAEQQARAARVGLWADAAPTPPWEFRHPTTAQTAPVAHRAAAHGSECHVGPRGGTYTITASGRKNYGGC
jgi:endonuclease YncB( thermonuclease family)